MESLPSYDFETFGYEAEAPESSSAGFSVATLWVISLALVLVMLLVQVFGLLFQKVAAVSSAQLGLKRAMHETGGEAPEEVREVLFSEHQEREAPLEVEESDRESELGLGADAESESDDLVEEDEMARSPTERHAVPIPSDSSPHSEGEATLRPPTSPDGTVPMMASVPSPPSLEPATVLPLIFSHALHDEIMGSRSACAQAEKIWQKVVLSHSNIERLMSAEETERCRQIDQDLVRTIRTGTVTQTAAIPLAAYRSRLERQIQVLKGTNGIHEDKILLAYKDLAKEYKLDGRTLNEWNIFQAKHAGRGLTQQQMSELYQKEKLARDQLRQSQLRQRRPAA